MRKVGVFGGTFNPVHKGHEQAAVDFYKKFNLSKLIVIPSNIPPHKQADEKILPAQRLEMCRICFNSGKYQGYNIEVSDIEIKKDGVSYTYDTLKFIREIYPGDEIYFLIGSDMFLYLGHWHRYRELLEMCVFVVAFRYNSEKRGNQKNCENCENFENSENQNCGEAAEIYDSLIKQGYKIKLLENVPFEISSTELRDRIYNNGCGRRDWAGLEKYLSPEVLDYIKEKKIYIL